MSPHRYKECDDGICRLQTVRFESLHLSQLLNEQEGQTNSPVDNASSPATSGGSPETSAVGSPCSNVEDPLEDQRFQDLLEQYGLSDNGSETLVRKPDSCAGPIRHSPKGRPTMVHPYERPDSPELDLPQALLDLHEAAIRLANAEQANWYFLAPKSINFVSNVKFLKWIATRQGCFCFSWLSHEQHQEYFYLRFCRDVLCRLSNHNCLYEDKTLPHFCPFHYIIIIFDFCIFDLWQTMWFVLEGNLYHYILWAIHVHDFCWSLVCEGPLV